MVGAGMKEVTVSLPAQLDVRMETLDGTKRMTLNGELDMSTCPVLQEGLDALMGTPSAIEIDLAGLMFMDSSGLSCMLAAKKRANEEGQGLRLVNASTQVQRLFEIAGVRDFLNGDEPAA
ncbi:MAG: hypothetical protein QOI81_1790 [Actinomycetota bacterium]|nr:hypothetical protein [Actinomycetota bacterium]